jgi:outer membrane protein assembly factor BamB
MKPFVGLLLLLPLSLMAADWPQFLGPDRNGISTETNLTGAWPAEGPPVRWQKSVGQGFSGPVVAGGKLILFHRLADQETIECLDAKTGGPIWHIGYPTHYQDDFGFDEGPRATPTVTGSNVYTMGAEGAVYCVDLASGREKWHVNCKEKFQAAKGFFGMACSPLVEGNAVILNIGGQDGAGIIALDAGTGALLWKKTDDEAGYSSPTAATVGGHRYAFVFTRAGLVGLNPVSGALYFDFPWRSRENASVNAATPLVSGNTVFLTASYETGAILLRINPDGAQKVWSDDNALSCHYATPVLRAGYLYGIHGRADPGMEPRPSLRCVEWATGRICWSEDNFGAASIILAGDQLFILTENGELLRAKADPKAFRASARAQVLPLGVRAFPALADGCFYARSKDKLVCLALK